MVGVKQEFEIEAGNADCTSFETSGNDRDLRHGRAGTESKAACIIGLATPRPSHKPAVGHGHGQVNGRQVAARCPV